MIPEDRVYFLWAFLFYFILFGTGGGGVGVEGREGGTRRMGTLSIFLHFLHLETFVWFRKPDIRYNYTNVIC